MAKLLNSLVPDLSPGVESIGFQDGAFFKELTKVFEDGRSNLSGVENKSSREFALAVAACVKKHTNLSIIFNYHDWGPAIYIPNLTVDHLFFNDRPYSVFYRGKNSELVELIKMYGSKFVGTVDLERSWVSDAYAHVKSHMLFPLGMIKDKRFTSAQLAAITLHETGHMFTTLEYMTNQIANNQVIATVAQGLQATDDKKERTALLNAAAVVQGAEKYIDVERIAEVKDPRIGTVVYLKNYRTYLADTGGRIITYNKNSCEQLADQFATRHGAGRDLVTGLARIYEIYGVDVRESYSASLLKDLVGTIFNTIGVIAVTFALPVLLPLILFILISILFSEPDNTYDKLRDRCVRVRNDMMEEIKNKKLPKDVLAIKTQQVADMDKFLKNFSQYASFLERFLNLINPIWRESTRQRDLAAELETMISNDLFLASAKLRTM